MLRSERHNAGGINFIMRHVIVAFDVVEIHSVRDAIILVEIFEVTEQIGIIGDAADVAFEVSVVDGVEADERDEQAPVGFDYS